MTENTSPSPNSAPSVDALKTITESLAGLAQWIAKLILEKNWFTLLLLVDVVLFFGFKPEGGIILALLNPIFNFGSLPWYGNVFWIILVSIFFAAIAVAVKTMPRLGKVKVKEGEEHKVIKGLRSFTVEDAEIFARLQRDQSIETCLQSLKSQEFRFGVLMGESGCGKSSFLQAGLLPKLNKTEPSYRGIYIKFTDRSPIETVRQALLETLATVPNLNQQKAATADLLTLMKVAPKALKQPVVMFFDQFEQFFVHQRKPADRQPFIQVLTGWYQAKPAIPVKILVGIRADLLHELYPLQQELGYTLGRYDMFKLEKFEPEEATDILQVIAETENWEFNRSFVTQLAEEQLTAADGKVSPVDLQILAETVRKQPQNQRALKEETFRKLGGLEGLLNCYLEETLEVLKVNNIYQPGIQVLLALIDREQGVRSGVLTLAELQEKLKGTVRPQEVQQATNWLASGEVRLITPVDRQGTIGYELAHERIIPAVVRLAGQELKAAERANQLLERRVNEWLGNGYSRRYLLPWQELWLLRQQRAYLVWGSNRRDKEKLLKQSWQRFYRVGWVVLLALLLVLAGFLMWLSPRGQLKQMQWNLVGLRQKISYQSHSEAALAFVKIGDRQQASKFADAITEPSDKAFVLSSIAEAYGKLNAPDIAKPLLEQARTSADAITEPSSKASVLSSIAEAYGKLNAPDIAKPLLEQARTSADAITEPSFKADALSSIAEAYGKLNAPDLAKPLLEQARTSAASITEPHSKAYALSSIAEAYGKLNAPDLAKLGLEQLRISADSITDPSFKAYALRSIAEAYGKLNAPDLAKPLLEQARTSADSITDPYSKAYALSSIAEAYGKLNAPDIAKPLLEQARTSADAITESSFKAYALSLIAEAYSNLNEPDIAKFGLDQLRTIANSISDPDSKADALSSIAAAYSNLNEPDIAKPLLEQAHTSADSISDPGSKAYALKSIAQVQAELQDWRQVNRTAASCTTNDCKADIFSTGLTGWAEQQHPELKEPEEEE